ncbi:bis(5'-nucleosyl)-tetraphosphatase (symmetrical) YqeK [Ornithinibacillus sp. BX22]|uniref:bis(5'-nucleosyl)-tetraphosphatase (symmetrical) n=2 Tax=Ornithinibacillus TaxID=484508 RepID=A0A923L9H9_9BACI|nr:MULTISPECIES: bis(5'-nucleosyl)-tetraphosphatase (symmetrical) YqeK [Ornithinibacillus]MBC5638774.1 bis(5'-nucleosyl)-tetraphosphatase (symmetrical) YqeK [Ornithinibacillus hominis]MBS3679516.1 bis(5'-nucleosyl)-tetraphosphatase (symmetrical) YqeK [Ornithinibacillus massiliensis]
MNKNDAIAFVEPHLTKQRFEHTLRVASTAVSLAKKYNVSPEKAELASIFHDYCKYRAMDEMKRIIAASNLPKDLLLYHHELWHGPVASIKIEEEFGITDHEVKSAIYYHTTGKANMSKLELIVFIADYIEPGRSFPGLDKVREMAQNDLIKAGWMVSRNTIKYLMEKENRIYPDTFHAYNDLTRLITGGNHIE